jgi:zinc transport system substrate-binding protein
MAAVVAHITEHDVTTIYTEPLAPRAVAETIAREAGVKVATLDPLEGITDSSAAQDYLGVMRANLATLREGQECR